ncbi:MAG: hypothetical protein PUB39_04595 [Eubacteriales bacterium]|nr:hypothetical protein [Eubacteriales bacterium]
MIAARLPKGSPAGPRGVAWLKAAVFIASLALAAIAMSAVCFAATSDTVAGLGQGAKTGIGEDGANSKVFIGQNQNDYSSWSRPKETAFRVDAEHSMRLESDYSAKGYPATAIEVTGNVTSKVTVSDAHSMDTDDYVVFRLDDGKKHAFTYRNLYIYDPTGRDSGRLTSGNAGFIPVDLKVEISEYKKALWGDPTKKGAHSKTDKPYIEFSKKIRGLPTVNMFNVGFAKVKYSYTYAAGPDKGKPFILKSNATYDDVDCYQSIGISEESANFYVDEATKLGYVKKSGYDYFLGATTENITSKDPNVTKKYAFGMTVETDTETFIYVSSFKNPSTSKVEKGTPHGAWAHFGASAVSMIRPVPPDPSKVVSDEDDLTASRSGSAVYWDKGSDSQTYVNGVSTPKGEWTYQIDQLIPAGISDKWHFSRMRFDDDISLLLDVKSVKVTIGSKDITSGFTVKVNSKGHVSAVAKDDLLDSSGTLGNVLYGSSSKKCRLSIKVALKRSLTLDDIRKAGALMDDVSSDGKLRKDSAVKIDNIASTLVDDRGSCKTGWTETYIRLPDMDAPYKRVLDADEPESFHNTVKKFDEDEFSYRIYQKFEADQIHQSDFTVTDSVDPCLSVPENQKLKITDETGADRSGWFKTSIKREGSGGFGGSNPGPAGTVVRAEALASALSDDAFYGHTYCFEWKNVVKSIKRYKSEGISKDFWEKEDHLNADDNLLTIPNQAKAIYDSARESETNQVKTGIAVDLETEFYELPSAGGHGALWLLTLGLLAAFEAAVFMGMKNDGHENR